jgi:two-component system, NtrC family, sensor histidine kinase HupT/HoxJ
MLTDTLVLQIMSFAIIMMLVFILIVIFRMKNKQQIHYAFMVTIICVLFWTLMRTIQLLTSSAALIDAIERIHYIGVCLLPVCLLYTGLIFARTHIKFSAKYLLVLVVPVVSIVMSLTNQYHHLFIVKRSFISTEFVYGPYYSVHEIYSYLCIAIGLYFLLYFSIKNSGFFSKQSLFLFIGIAIPLSVVVLSTQKIVVMPVFYENMSFAFCILFFAIAIFKFQFLNVVPIALQRIVDLISDSYAVVNENLEVIDYNQTLVNQFQGVLTIKRKDNLARVFSSPLVAIDVATMIAKTHEACELKATVAYEEHMVGVNFDKYFTIEITPIYTVKNYIGAVVLFKDVSEHNRNIEIIKRNQEMLMEKERLASLGQMIGGIAHNLKTPIMSISGGIEGLLDLIDEYDNSIGDNTVTNEDHHAIAQDMRSWIEKIKPHCSYMSDVISTVKGQATQFNVSEDMMFTLDELTKRVDLLMKHELNRFHCNLVVHCDANPLTEIKGDINSLVQILDNLIINAIQAYEGKSGTIELLINEQGSLMEFSIKDYGKGIPLPIQEKLFKEMVTTKGKDGTGLGLYMSYATIKANFGGNMHFQSEPGKGSSFTLTIPCGSADLAYQS